MKPKPQDRFFKPSRSESKADMTTRVARSIIDGEAARLDAKTERLRAARLAREGASTCAAPTKLERRAPRRKG